MAKFKSILLVAFLFQTSTGFAKNKCDYDRLVVFGDSLSDLGTYSKVAAPIGGGKFTTNPGQIWIEIVAKNLHLNLSANRYDGFNQPVELLKGLDYAQGGARVTNVIGYGVEKGYSARPVVEQLLYFVQEHKQFHSEDLVLIQGGANDIFVLLGEVSQGKKTPEQAVKDSVQAAMELAALVKKTISLSAKKVYVQNLPQVEKTPKIILLDLKVQKFVEQMVLYFNQTLAQGLKDQKAKLIDINSFDKNFNEHYVDYGFVNITEQACVTEGLPIKSSLMCSEKSLVNSDAKHNYKFADAIHPTTGYSKAIADYILKQLNNCDF